MVRFNRLLLAVTIIIGIPACATADVKGVLENVTLPPGFKIELYAKVPSARTIIAVPEIDTVFVGNRRSDAIYAIQDKGLKGQPEKITKAATNLKVPNGIAWKNGALYVAEQHRIIRIPVGTDGLPDTAKTAVLFEGLPDDSWHGWRYGAFGPDDAFYVAVGAPCNVCDIKGMEGTIQRFDAKTWKPTTFASGVRNSVGLAFHPETKELFFTDNGADMMGDDSPPDELNHAPNTGLHFGYPYYGGGKDRTPDFESQTAPADIQFPVVNFNAHVAALGIEFYRGRMFPKEYRTDAFVAQHGSWNRTVPDGYRIMRIRFDEKGRVLGKETFATGFYSKGQTLGRPVDLETLPDGSLLISDDKAGAIYRITYSTP